MVKIQVNSQGKAYFTSGNKVLLASDSGSGDTITATNTTSSTVNSGDKVWINKSGNNYNIVSYYGNTANYSVNGYPTINNKVVSNFGTNDCLILEHQPPYTSLGGINSMEAVFKIHTPTTWESNGRIINGRTNYDDFSLDINQTNPTFCFLNSDISDNKTIQVAPSGMSSDTDYWIKVTYDGTNLVGSYSLDGENYTVQASIARQPSELYLGSSQYTIGNRYMSNGSSMQVCVWNGSIDLKESYIKINGFDWWAPYNCNITQDSLTGVANETIAVSSSGIVKTVLES